MKIRQLVLPLALVCSPSFAATDGSLGSTSTGDTDVSITIDDLVQVLVEGDVGLTHTLGVDSTGSTGLCIYRNGNADVNVTFTSANPSGGNGFRMAAGANFLPYTVDFSGTTTSVSGVTSGAVNTINDENNTSSNCGGVYPHTLSVTALTADLDAASAGAYTDTITILVEPI